MSVLTTDEIALFIGAANRYRRIDALHHEGELDAQRARSLIGKQCKVGHKVYKIERVHYGWNGLINARGRRILKDGKLGSQVWDIGAISAINFAPEDGQ